MSKPKVIVLLETEGSGGITNTIVKCDSSAQANVIIKNFLEMPQGVGYTSTRRGRILWDPVEDGRGAWG